MLHPSVKLTLRLCFSRAAAESSTSISVVQVNLFRAKVARGKEPEAAYWPFESVSPFRNATTTGWRVLDFERLPYVPVLFLALSISPRSALVRRQTKY